ncbi:hypothetical protein RDI61_16735 [Pseudomonas plecoglossicida]|uniref:hypothetical protein n=1 Tax=Pseudomonas putida group TaxID=136845 RepID=UPI0024100FEF|nr:MULTISPECIES: hypothetical protein [Pseudomonas putida group]MDQ7965672.1 hypothetical protein [Pseudomonas plecoglossicida]WFG04508.1 hypothetical protein P3X84_07755 [Pseudomonas putida]
MAGQIIILPGVTAAAAAGAPRISMNAPDSVAAKIANLKHVVSARTLTRDGVEGVIGRCRNTGQALITKGVNRQYLTLVEAGGKTALALPSVTLGQAGLALPANSLTPSFTMVKSIYLSATDIAFAGAGNLLSGFSASDSYIAALLRWYGAGSGTLPNMLASSTTTGQPVSTANPAASTWAVVVIDYNNETRRLSLSLNQADTFASGVKATDFAPGANSYLEIGYHIGSESLREAKVGDLYTFSDSLLRTDMGKSQLKDLVAALKTYYGI